MGGLLIPTWAIRLDFAVALVDDEPRCRRVAEILVRACFHELNRLSIHRGDRWIEHGPVTVERIIKILLDRDNKSATLETGRGRELAANAEILNGTYASNEGDTRFNSELVFPLEQGHVEAVVSSICELAAVLGTGAGFLAIEPDYHKAHRLALGLFKPQERPALSERRRIERRGRDWHRSERQTLLAGPEWGTFLGAQHLAKLDLEQVRKSGAFARVVEIMPRRLAFLQVTEDPEDDLREDFEAKLIEARKVLAPIAMHLSDVNLD